jgi:hypothetical protein
VAAYAENAQLGARTGPRWRGKQLVDRDGEKIGKLQDVYVYVDVETDEPQFGTVKEGISAAT